MAIGTTLKEHMIVPEVMADFIDSQLPNHIAFYPLLKIDQTLVGQPGDTLTRPAWAYSGDATDVLENTAIPIDQLTASVTTATIKKIGKAIELTDEAVLSGAGGVMNAASRDIGMAIGNKVEKDVLAALQAYSVQTATIDASVEGLNSALLSFANMRDFNEKSIMVVSPVVAAAIRLDAIQAGGWLSGTELGANRVVSGVYGEVLNTQFLVHDLVGDDEAFLIRSGAIAMLDKRGMFLETDRDILKKTTVLSADKHYGIYIYDPTRIVKLTVNAVVDPEA